MPKKKTKKLNNIRFQRFKKNIDFFKKNKKVFGFIFILISLYCFIAFISSFFNWKEDFSELDSWYDLLTNPEIETNNSLGKIGTLLSYLFIWRGVGISAFLIPVFFILSGIHLIGYRIISMKIYIRQSIWALIWIPVFMYHVFDHQMFAGSIGVHSANYLVKMLGNIGTTLLLITIFIIFISVKFNFSLHKVI